VQRDSLAPRVGLPARDAVEMNVGNASERTI
jgi:hypothetical protein